jgi:hypothetical protein
MKPNIVHWLMGNEAKGTPVPEGIVVELADGKTQTIALSGAKRNRWKNAADNVKNLGAVKVFCVDAKGNVLRSRSLVDEEGDVVEDPDDVARKRFDNERRKSEIALAHERVELAHVLDRYGDRLNEAFERGAAAAGTSQENLVSLVQVLTAHLANAITNLHNVSVNLANFVQSSATGEEPASLNGQNGQLIAGLLTQVLAKGGLNGQPTKEAK